MEHSSVIKISLEMLPYLNTCLDVEKIPSASDNFGRIKCFVRAELLTAKLGFVYSFLELEQYLFKFKTNHSLLPFMCSDLCSLLEHMMNEIVKHEVLQLAKTDKKSHHRINIGFAAAAGLEVGEIKEASIL
ncbi:hypothetical protein PR048_013707 [Dryococelus australis]|uniref:Uncharacterized protein n=1 Tax=Dryococelus australis TaxID=614101 RepID=A0ABQ9HSW8_9NEOP|nr:hypothetical protein PR048_013707 [Dryococelus australis]